MFTLPKKRMTLSEVLPAIFITWKSMILSLLALSFLCVLTKNLPILAAHAGLFDPTQKKLFLAANVICFLAYLPPLGALIYRISNAVHGVFISNTEALRTGFSRFFKLLLLFIILFLLVFIMAYISSLLASWHVILGKIFLALSAIILAPYFTPAIPLAVIDNKFPFDAIRSSFTLVNANWLFVFLTVVAISIVTIILNILAAKLGVAAEIIINILTLPLTLTMTVLITENLKLKK